MQDERTSRCDEHEKPVSSETTLPATTEPMSMAVDVAAPLAPVGFDSETALAQVEDAIGFMASVKRAALRRTTPKDWLEVQGGEGGPTMYLQSKGAMKLAPIFGVQYRGLRMRVVMAGGIPVTEPHADDWLEQTKFLDWCREHKDEIVGFECTGEARSTALHKMANGCAPEPEEGWTEIVGGRSSRDPFFARQKGMDILDVRKAAHSNWLARAVTTILGLGGLTRSDLTADGVAVEGAASYTPKQGAHGAHGGSTEAPADDVRAKSAELMEIAMTLAGGDTASAQVLVGDWSQFEGNDGNPVRCRGLGQLEAKPKWLNKVLHNAHEAYKAAGVAKPTPNPNAPANAAPAQPQAAVCAETGDIADVIASIVGAVGAMDPSHGVDFCAMFQGIEPDNIEASLRSANPLLVRKIAERLASA